MADFFGGLKSFAIEKGWMRSDEQEKLDNMIKNYENGGTEAHKQAATVMKVALKDSPDLKARTLEAVRDGYLQSYTDSRPGAYQNESSLGAYSASDKQLWLPPQLGLNEQRLVARIFLMGHETEHARSTKGIDYGTVTMTPTAKALAASDSAGPRDYTGIVDAYVERTRGEEGRAQIGGFNALASYLINDKSYKPEHFLRDLYELQPSQIGDFIQKSSDAQPAVYKLKPGLTLGQDGMMPYSPQNIEAMKVYFADTAGYRSSCIRQASVFVNELETHYATMLSQDRSYVIDPVRLKADPTLGLAADGLHRVQGTPQLSTLDIESGQLFGIPMPIPSQATTQSVPLAPQPGDHPLFAQALTQVVAFNRDVDTLGAPQELRNIAAALAVAAEQRGLKCIDKIGISEDLRGLIASQGVGDSGNNARVEGETAARTPEAESLAKLGPIAQIAPAETTQQTPTIVQSSTISQQKT